MHDSILDQIVTARESVVRYAKDRDHSTSEFLAAAAVKKEPGAHEALLDHLMESDHPLQHVALASANRDRPPFTLHDHPLTIHSVAGLGSDPDAVSSFDGPYVISLRGNPARKDPFPITAVATIGRGDGEHRVHGRLSLDEARDTLQRMVDEEQNPDPRKTAIPEWHPVSALKRFDELVRQHRNRNRPLEDISEVQETE